MLAKQSLSSHGFHPDGNPAPDATKPIREIPVYSSVSSEPLLVLQFVSLDGMSILIACILYTNADKEVKLAYSRCLVPKGLNTHSARLGASAVPVWCPKPDGFRRSTGSASTVEA